MVCGMIPEKKKCIANIIRIISVRRLIINNEAQSKSSIVKYQLQWHPYIVDATQININESLRYQSIS